MTATIGDVRAGLKARLATISGLHASATMPAKPAPPAAAPKLLRWRYDPSFEGGAVFTFLIWVYVDRQADLNRAQTALDAYLSPTGTNSIPAAIKADPRLGNAVDSTSVSGGEDYGLVEIGGSNMLAGAVEVEVLAS